MIAFLQRMVARICRRVQLSRYRVTPRQNPRVLRREVLAAIIHTLNRDPGQNAHG